MVRKLKVVVIGQSQTGKTSFINLLKNKSFNHSIPQTNQYQISLLKFTIAEIDYQVQLWDCGNKHMDNNDLIRSAFFRNASAAFLTFDVSDPTSIQKIPAWIQESYENQCYLIHVCGMKKDLIQDLDERFLSQFLQEYKLEDRLKLFSCRQYRQKMIKGIFHQIDRDSKMDRSTIVKGLRFSRLSNLRRTYIEEQT